MKTFIITVCERYCVDYTVKAKSAHVALDSINIIKDPSEKYDKDSRIVSIVEDKS